MQILVSASEKDVKSPIVSGIREYYYPTEKDPDNHYYSELSTLHHIWKEVDDDIVGLEHYRRFFIDKTYDPIRNGFNSYKILNSEKIEHILSGCDAILIIQYEMYPNIMSCLCSEAHLPCGDPNDPQIKQWIFEWLLFIRDKDPDFGNWVFNTMFHSQAFFANNMFITKKEIISKYCEYLFPKIEEFAKSKTNLPLRIFGYFSEYLMGYWFLYNHYSVDAEYKICFTKDLTNVGRFQFTKSEIIDRQTKINKMKYEKLSNMRKKVQ